MKNGEVRRGWLGVHIQTVTDEIAESLGLDKAKGAMVASVIEDGPADNAKFKAGDVILSFGGVPVPDTRDLQRIVADVEPETTVDAEIWRDGKKKTLKVEVGALKRDPERSGQASAPGKTEKRTAASARSRRIGLTVASDHADSMRERFKLSVTMPRWRDRHGRRSASGPAAEKGLRPGDRIIQVSQSDVNEPADVSRKVDEAKAQGRKSVLLRVARGTGRALRRHPPGRRLS